MGEETPDGEAGEGLTTEDFTGQEIRLVAGRRDSITEPSRTGIGPSPTEPRALATGPALRSLTTRSRS